MIHNTPAYLLTKTVKIGVIGAGGTGSHIITGLARLNTSIKALGHPGGIEAHLYDPDRVTDSNVARQLFYQSDVGQFKSEILVNRLNIGFGCKFISVPRLFTSALRVDLDIVIGCVDTRKSRRYIYSYLKNNKQWTYCIDCGNDSDFGQVYAGYRNRNVRKDRFLIPYEKNTGLIKKGKEDIHHSCSIAESLNSQELFINQTVSTFAMQLLWSIFRHGGLPCLGYYINLKEGRVVPI